MFSSSDIRREAREALGGRFFGSEWLYPVLAVFIVSVISGFGGSVPFAGLIISGPLAVASAAYFLARARRRGSYDDLGIMIDAGKEDIGGNIVLGILTSLFTVLWTLLFIIPGIVKSISYSMASFIKKDNPHFTATEAINESRRIMNGYKWKYFCLQISFIGWYIVGFLCIGVGVMWASALNNTANAVFYERLLKARGIVSPDENGAAMSDSERPLWESVVTGNQPWHSDDEYSDDNGDGNGSASSKSVNPEE